MNNLTGQKLGNYRLAQLLGAGGNAQVYLGEHIHFKWWAAIKVLNAQVINQELLTRFLAEAKIIANLQHPNIVPILEFSVEDNVPFMVWNMRRMAPWLKGSPAAYPCPQRR